MREKITWEEFEQQCQKPLFRETGSWMARKIGRPLALFITWQLRNSHVSANQITTLALLIGCFAAILLAWGTITSWLIGALLLVVWYVFDHVDGQLARWQHQDSLDGTSFDYLMHHLLNLCIPLGIGYGCCFQNVTPIELHWLWCGFFWGISSLVLTLNNDTRYKAFIKRLKSTHENFRVRQYDQSLEPASAPQRSGVRRVVGICRLLCESHSVMNAILLISILQCVLLYLFQNETLWLCKSYLLCMSVLSFALAVWDTFRGIQQQRAENEFVYWYQPLSSTEDDLENCNLERSDEPHKLAKPQHSTKIAPLEK